MKHALKQESKLLQHILSKLDVLQKYHQFLTRYLEPEVAKHCEVAKFDKNCLIVIVDNGNWATQLRFQIPELLVNLRRHPGLENLSGIVCKTRPKVEPGARPGKKSVRMAKLTAATAENIGRTAESITHGGLRAVLKKIAGNLR